MSFEHTASVSCEHRASISFEHTGSVSCEHRTHPWSRILPFYKILPETGREPLHLGTRARCTSCPRGSDFRSKCIRRSPIFPLNLHPKSKSDRDARIRGSDLSALEHKMCTVHCALTSVHWSTRCSLLRNPSDGIAATRASP